MADDLAVGLVDTTGIDGVEISAILPINDVDNYNKIMIRPVRKEGKWYLTLAGENQATFSSQIDKQ